jgi:hypothetical protein
VTELHSSIRSDGQTTGQMVRPRSVPHEAKPVALTMGVRNANVAVVKKTIDLRAVCSFVTS